MSCPTLQRGDAVHPRCSNQASTSYCTSFVSKKHSSGPRVPEPIRDGKRRASHLCRSGDGQHGRTETMKETTKASSSSSQRSKHVCPRIDWLFLIACLRRRLFDAEGFPFNMQESSGDREVNSMPYGLITVLASAGALETAYLTLVRTFLKLNLCALSCADVLYAGISQPYFPAWCSPSC